MVISLSCRGVMGLAAASFANALFKHHKVCLVGGEEFPVKEVIKDITLNIYPIKGQSLIELMKINIYQKLIADIWKFKPDAVVFYSSHLHNLFLLLWAKRNKIATAFVFHDPAERADYHFFSKQYLFNIGMQIHNKIIIKFVNKVFTTYKDAVYLVQQQCHLRYNKVIDIPLIPLTELATWNKFNEYSAEKKFDLVLFGRVDNYKDYDTFFKALNIVQERDIHCSVLAIIQGDISVFKHHCADHLWPSVTLINDFLEETEFEELVSSAKIAVFPYSGATGSHGPSVAFSLGVPVIATNVGCFQEYIQTFGIGKCVEPKDPYALAQVIIDLLNTPTPKELVHQKFAEGTAAAKKRLYEVINTNLDIEKQKWEKTHENDIYNPPAT